MMQLENRIKGRNPRVSHMSIPANIDMNSTVNAFDGGQCTLTWMDLVPSVIGKLTPGIGLKQLRRKEI